MSRSFSPAPMDNLNYGVIGNCKSAALVSQTGSIDWCCLPDFDSSSFFGAILDQNRGGRFAIEPIGDYTISQAYVERTNILKTSFCSGDDSFDLYDYMPRYKSSNGAYHCPPDLVRHIRHIRGNPRIRVHYSPQPAYAQHSAKLEETADCLKVMTTQGSYESAYLYSNLPLGDIARAEEISITQDSFMLMSYNQKLIPPNIDWVHLEYQRTKIYWLDWLSKTQACTEYQEHLERSILVLKLLAYQKTGAILAAVTTSLPETIGEVRNWDYRYCWLRDASMTIRILARLGHYNVAQRFLDFILDIIPFKNEKIQIMYSINPRRQIKELELPWLAGYEGSTPVRVGNAAVHQKQNDIYGIVLEVIHETVTLFQESLDTREDLWTVTRTLARHIENNWHGLDSGIWEFRSEQKHFTFSKILCWVGMDRAAKIAEIFSRPQEAKAYAALRDEIRADILTHGVDPKTNALTQYYGGEAMDAANLLAEEYGFLTSDDLVFRNTVLETYKQLSHDGLMYRYNTPDDFGQPKSSFTVCTFWMIKCLFLIGREDQAREMFETLLGYSNHLGLFSEDIDFATKRLLGNFPQGYSHLALIDTALTLSPSSEWFQEAPQYG